MPVFVSTFQRRQNLVFDHERASVSDIKQFVEDQTGIPIDILSISHRGRNVSDNQIIPNDSSILVHSNLPGGKGGFGSMLRAIGAQIEKTTNREACRDLSGRRLRDINEEKRLKHWLAKQKEREAEANQKKQEKLVKITQEPKHKFHDPDYDKFRSELSENISSAVEEGLKKSVQIEQDSSKRKQTPEVEISAKKRCLWLGIEEDLSDCSEETDNEDTTKVSEDTKDEELKDNSKEKPSLDLNQYESVEDLQEKLGDEGMRALLKDLGLKTGGTQEQRAQRLWSVIRGKRDKIDPLKLSK